MSIKIDESVLVKLETIFRKSAVNKTEIDWEIKKAFTTGIDKKFFKVVTELLAPYTKDIIGDFEIHIAMLLEESIPLDIHTDYVKGDENPGYALLIPLETVDAHTIIFNEECIDSFEMFQKNNDPLEKNATEYQNTLLSHCTPEELSYVSIKKIEKWERGKLIHWDRRLLHTSDNFVTDSVKEKTAIVIFASKG